MRNLIFTKETVQTSLTKLVLQKQIVMAGWISLYLIPRDYTIVGMKVPKGLLFNGNEVDEVKNAQNNQVIPLEIERKGRR